MKTLQKNEKYIYVKYKLYETVTQKINLGVNNTFCTYRGHTPAPIELNEKNVLQTATKVLF